MQGNTEQQQLILISQLCGSITTEVWPGVENLELFNKMDLPKGQKRKVIISIILNKKYIFIKNALKIYIFFRLKIG